MKTNNDSKGHKRKYNEMTCDKKDNVKNIPLQTKRDIKAEKKKYKKEKKEKMKSLVRTNKCKQGAHGGSTSPLFRNEQDTQTKKSIAVDEKAKQDEGALKKHHRVDNIKHVELKDSCTPRGKNMKREREVTTTPDNISTVLDGNGTTTHNVLCSSVNKPVDNFEASGMCNICYYIYKINRVTIYLVIIIIVQFNIYFHASRS